MTKLKSILSSTHKGILAILGTGILSIATIAYADTAADSAAQPRQLTQEEIQQIMEAQRNAQQAQLEAMKQQLQAITPEQESKIQQDLAWMMAQQMRPDLDMLGLSAKEKASFIENFVAALNLAEEPQVDQQSQMLAIAYFQKRAEDSQVRALEEAEKVYAEFLQSLDQRKEVVTTASGLKYEVLTQGEGNAVQDDSIVTVHYKGTLPDGTEFDNSYERGTPLILNMAQAQTIPGFLEGLKLGKKGSKLRLYIPSKLGYGAATPPGLPLGAPLVFEVEFLDIQAAEK